ncbi:HK97-gp10 family putative phage morphogenesis protein [Streptococcus suis]|uniref:HK97-gp10 family putative phage morphogenesis protein n=1 Tax=Streptococcus suis TaxID=1307 RepID=UPI001557D0CD|nr:HK97-gp10 family putative phage morphogenesis protein [Streptococcus suis]MCO8179568.1 HK97 gp10 family phage protein [Streptococcus suis]NQR20622.1 HK97 gp10 family phage protein [Streptococcus suis]HEM3466043.1 HK97 gp10 family phage protein [Streptococcus suis]HEM5651200.1 HK97 gp10 family phage protein [Streptococcus suis]HEM6059966.1 HK97 gp10 family phage protein [Streptococcus suis]
MTKGVDKILANLTKLQVKAPRVARAAVKQVADEFGEELKKNTPVSDDLFGHLAEEVVVTGFKGANQGIIAKDIGYGHKTGWRSHFPDDGTIYQAPQDFKEKTINTMTPRAKEIYAEKVREGLKL